MPHICFWRIKNEKENIVSSLFDEIIGCIDHINWMGYSSFSIEFNIRDKLVDILNNCGCELSEGAKDILRTIPIIT